MPVTTRKEAYGKGIDYRVQQRVTVAAARRAQPFEAIEAMIQQTLGLGSAS
ncbi:hypothetical protein [Sorangium sp. So ce128]|uniref:hypothetical protein n=1 Tax=Sorangium sp. So ce128 TaxID=3133281 RepID=UPI003F60C07E